MLKWGKETNDKTNNKHFPLWIGFSGGPSVYANINENLQGIL